MCLYRIQGSSHCKIIHRCSTARFESTWFHSSFTLFVLCNPFLVLEMILARLFWNAKCDASGNEVSLFTTRIFLSHKTPLQGGILWKRRGGGKVDVITLSRGDMVKLMMKM
ncbi:hypothetical protein K461DRAFT_167286 [Myriangium duriaei CBS 260.36]|uniref:Uncharacterized protein n=1 Tax=Myriangium duriaei CBS 260.36 TaxID=1168546 RepID=A0A9P4IWB7_9PEZI|nr:hypothetical protein K461DRAFT_167286 [Myriangium duriaei CBS 260.36]